MKSVLLRTGSIPVQRLNRTLSLTGSSVHYTSSSSSSPRVSFRSEKVGFGKMKRSSSDTDLIRSELSRSGVISRVGSVSYPDLGVIVEEEGFGIGNGNYFGGKGKGGKNNNGNNNDHGKSNDKMDEYYKEMLKSNPGDSLLLRNYGKYLHEVEKNVEKAEEYYGRAILANPGDGELLSLYGNLIWETSKDEDRANLYFDQAVNASPNDCMVLGSYAHFLWETEDDDVENQDFKKHENACVLTMVGVH